MKSFTKSHNLRQSSMRAGIDRKTGRKYLRQLQAPIPENSEYIRSYHRTRLDPLAEVWPSVTEFLLQFGSCLPAKELFEYLQSINPEKFKDSHLRTFQRRVKAWKAIEGNSKEVMFSQIHYPGDLSSSDFTHMNDLEVTIQGKPFQHMLYHFVLTYSNWEHASICHSESFLSFQSGFQNAVQALGGMTTKHRVDSLATAVKNSGPEKGQFTTRFKSLMSHYKCTPQHTNPYSGHENGDAEKSHNILKRKINSMLILRGSRDFESVDVYNKFIQQIIMRLNKNRSPLVEEDISKLHTIPLERLSDFRCDYLRVRNTSTIQIDKKQYSVPSRLIGEKVEVRIFVDKIEVWYANKKIDTLPKVLGEKKGLVQYQHIIDSLIQKPGAFENYVYKEDLFPTTIFRIAYDRLKSEQGLSANKQYLKILHLAAYEGQTKVESVLRMINLKEDILTSALVNTMLNSMIEPYPIIDIQINEVCLNSYDLLMPECSDGVEV